MEIYTTIVSGKIFKIKTPIIHTKCMRTTCINKYCDNFNKKLNGQYCNKCRGILNKKEVETGFSIDEIIESSISIKLEENTRFVYVIDLGVLFATDMVRQGSKCIIKHKDMEDTEDHIMLKELLIKHNVEYEEIDASFCFNECFGYEIHRY